MRARHAAQFLLFVRAGESDRDGARQDGEYDQDHQYLEQRKAARSPAFSAHVPPILGSRLPSARRIGEPMNPPA